MGILDVSSLDSLVKGELVDGGPRKLFASSDACLSHAAVLPDGRGFSAVQTPGGSGLEATLSFGDDTVGIEGSLGAVALARGPFAGVGSVAWRRSTLTTSAHWELRDWDLHGSPRSTPLALAGGETDDVVLRAGPGHLYAVGVKSEDARDFKWTIASMEETPKQVPLVCQGETAEAGIDDVALLKAADGVDVIGVSATCPGAIGRWDAAAAETRLRSAAGIDVKALGAALKDRMSAIAWATVSGEPLGILSWRYGQDRRASAHQFIVAPTKKPGETRPSGGLYAADLSEYAFFGPGETRPVCQGLRMRRETVFDHLRVTGLSIDPAGEGRTAERPRVSFATTGVSGAVSIIETGRDAETRHGARPAPGDTPRMPSAVCNTGDFVDYRNGEPGSIWARAREGGEIVRLGTDACEKERVGGTTEGRRYHMPSRGAPSVQILDADEQGHLTSLIVAAPGTGAAARPFGPCPLRTDANLAAGTGKCTAVEVAAAFQMPGAEIEVLWRDVSSDPRRRRSGDTVVRAYALALLGSSAAGSRKVRIIDLPVDASGTGKNYSLPDDALPVAVLTHAGASALVASSGGKYAAYVDDAGTKRGEVVLDDAFTDLDKTRRLRSAERLLLVANGADPASSARLMALQLGDDGLTIAPRCSPCDLQTDASMLELQGNFTQRPTANAEGRLDRFAVDERFSRLLFPATALRWAGSALDGGPDPVLAATVSSLPYLIGGGQAYMAGGGDAIDSWTVE